jgi:DNA/RNA-binding domain of Phe-tRNA-synthetase-like protein
MHFSHDPAIRTAHPELVAGVAHVQGIRADLPLDSATERWEAVARERLGRVGSESDLAEVQAWRRAFGRMGLKPTQYRCAAESLLRRLRKEGKLPRLHPLVDFCNALSVAFAIPVAALDLDQVAGWVEVRPADGTERYLAFSGETEHPEPGEVSFVDALGQAHARRWTHRQSGLSAVREPTRRVLVVAEALHPQAGEDLQRLLAALQAGLAEAGAEVAAQALLTAPAPRFEF